MASDALGLIHLGDLQTGYPWSTSQLTEVLALMRWANGPATVRRWDPPPALVVFVPGHMSAEHVANHRTWLRRASRITLVQDTAGVDVTSDPELAEALAHERGELAAAIGRGRGVDVLAWDRTPSSTADLIERITAHGAGALQTDPGPPAIVPSRGTNGPPGHWLEWHTASLGGLGAIARAVCMAEDRPAILDIRREPATLVGLRDAMVIAEIEPILRDVAVAPAADFTLGLADGGLEIGPLFGARQRVAAGHFGPIAIDPSLQVGAAGGRCWFRWLCFDDGEASLSVPVVHDWPCGHGKKLWGHMNNEPVRVEVAAERDAYLSIYDVDAIVGSHIMPSWRRAGPGWVPQWPPHDPARALYTCPDWNYASGGPAAVAVLDEDCRGDAPAIALGPDADHRYAVGLDREVWRIVGDQAERVGGPDDGYQVCDADHRRVRQAEGRLLCGSGSWLFVEHDGAVWREDIRSGERSRRTEVDRKIDAAVPIVRAGLAVLVHCVDADGDAIKRVPFFHERFELRLV